MRRHGRGGRRYDGAADPVLGADRGRAGDLARQPAGARGRRHGRGVPRAAARGWRASCRSRFLFMSYYNISFVRGIERFARRDARGRFARRDRAGPAVRGRPAADGGRSSASSWRRSLCYAPTTSDARMRAIAEHARGFVYCVARQRRDRRRDRVRLARRLSRALPQPRPSCRSRSASASRAAPTWRRSRGKVDIAVVGSETIRVVEQQGVGAVGNFIRGLR